MSLCRATQVSRSWFHMANVPKLWMALCRLVPTRTRDSGTWLNLCIQHIHMYMYLHVSHPWILCTGLISVPWLRYVFGAQILYTQWVLRQSEWFQRSSQDLFFFDVPHAQTIQLLVMEHWLIRQQSIYNKSCTLVLYSATPLVTIRHLVSPSDVSV